VTTLCTWEAAVPGRAASGVSDDPAAAEEAARKWLRANQGVRARLELVTLAMGAGSLAGAYVRTGTAWQVVLCGDNRIRVRAVPKGTRRKRQRQEGLSAREREVAGLAAAGLIDRRIATQLGISERTVHAHLRSAYAKTGTGSKVMLANWLTDHPPGLTNVPSWGTV